MDYTNSKFLSAYYYIQVSSTHELILWKKCEPVVLCVWSIAYDLIQTEDHLSQNTIVLNLY